MPNNVPVLILIQGNFIFINFLSKIEAQCRVSNDSKISNLHAFVIQLAAAFL